jgi:hypothetical protein
MGMGQHRKKVCPGCGGDMDYGATMCRACYDKQRAENKWPYYRGKTPLKLCPGCEKNWIIKYSQFCRDCYKLRKTKAWKEAASQFAMGLEHRHFWVPHDTYHKCTICSLQEAHRWISRDTYHQCAICRLKEPHYWILHQLTNYGVCKYCGAEKQFATPKEQAYILAHAYLQPALKKVPALLDEERIPV